MDMAYFVENTSGEFVDNSGLFKIITDLEIEEQFIYSDTAGSRHEFEKLLDDIDSILSGSTTKRLVVRSVTDLADTAKELKEILSDLQDKGVILLFVVR